MSTIELLVKPRSKNDRIGLGPERIVQVWVTSPPHEGKANRHVVKLLAKALGIPQSAVTIARGATGKHKVVHIEQLDTDEIMMRLKKAHSRKKGS